MDYLVLYCVDFHLGLILVDDFCFRITLWDIFTMNV